MAQPHLIQRILDALNLTNDAKMRNTLANTILYKDDQDKQRVQKWNYHSIIGILTNLSSASRPDISFAVH